MEQNNYMSLYDFLGKPAGGELGKQVADAAKEAKIKFEIRPISNPKYTGNVMLYPKSFLELYFKTETNILPFG
jgi:hypothetical protein